MKKEPEKKSKTVKKEFVTHRNGMYFRIYHYTDRTKEEVEISRVLYEKLKSKGVKEI